jgi:hypothetical protein
MNPQFENTRDLHPPQPTVESGIGGFEPGQGVSSPEYSGPAGESVPQPSAVMPPTTSAGASPVPIPGMPTDDTSAVSASVAGDDDDALDEEWINKAKAIVEQTRTDPFQQSNQMSKVKATYLKTHYNKDIKVAEDLQ